ncbi:MAG: hypothetical protein V4683_01865 [Bacteroidota bacterium]
MKILNRNIKISPKFKFFEFLGVFCALVFTTSLFLGNGYKAAIHQTNSNPSNTQNKHFQDSRSTSKANILFAFDSIEESEPTDESSEDEIIESGFSHYFTTIFLHNNLKSSFANFSQSLQKRTKIPFFLLHHSLKIPFA